MMASEQFSLYWDNFHKNMTSTMNALLENEDLVDVTIAVEGRHLKAHKMVLSICSPYFGELFKVTPCKHPIVFLKDVSYTTMNDLLQFMYQGEVEVSQEHLTTFIKTAEALQIKGLTGDGNGVVDCGKRVQEGGLKTEVLKSMEWKNQLQRFESSVPKNPQLVQTALSQPSAIKTESALEVESATGALSSEQLLKLEEPSDQDEYSYTGGDDHFDDCLMDDSLDINEDYTLIQSGDEELKVERSSNNETEEDEQDSAVTTMMVKPNQSRGRYEHAYLKFEKWYQQKGKKEISESVVLSYFQEKAETQKSSTLWATYSMLRNVIFIKKQIDIKRYSSVLAFLKRMAKGYKATKAKTFTKEEIDLFLTEADDRTYLMMKIVLILGIVGACKKEELISMDINNVRDEGNYIQITIPNRKEGVRNEFILTDRNVKGFSLLEMFRKYMNRRGLKTDHHRFFVNYKNGKCTGQPISNHALSNVPIRIAEFLELENPRLYTFHALRTTSSSFLLNGTFYNA